MNDLEQPQSTMRRQQERIGRHCIAESATTVGTAEPQVVIGRSLGCCPAIIDSQDDVLRRLILGVAGAEPYLAAFMIPTGPSLPAPAGTLADVHAAPHASAAPSRTAPPS
jgi:hypothetical protein